MCITPAGGSIESTAEKRRRRGSRGRGTYVTYGYKCTCCRTYTTKKAVDMKGIAVAYLVPFVSVDIKGEIETGSNLYRHRALVKSPLCCHLAKTLGGYRLLSTEVDFHSLLVCRIYHLLA